jgi:hypothetical protein
MVLCGVVRRSELLKMHEDHGGVAFVNHLLTEIEGVNGVAADFPAGCGLGQDAGEHHVAVRQSDECGDLFAGFGDEEFVVGHGVVGEGLAGILDRHFGLENEIPIDAGPGGIGDPIPDVRSEAPATQADCMAMLGGYSSPEGPVPGDFDLVEVVLKDVVHGAWR